MPQKQNASIAKMGSARAMEVMANSPLVMFLGMEPHQIAVGSAFMEQTGIKSLAKASDSVKHLLPEGYDPNDDPILHRFLVDFETIRLGVQSMSSDVLYMEAYRQYLAACTNSDSAGMATWFKQLVSLQDIIERAKATRKVTME